MHWILKLEVSARIFSSRVETTKANNFSA